MPKRYRKMTETERVVRISASRCAEITKAVLERFESDIGRKPNCHDLALLFGGGPNVWGRILKGVGNC